MGYDAGLMPRDIQALLATSVFGRRLYYTNEVDSTNRVAKEFARAGEPDGTVVIADFQTAGRGRRERQWVSPRGTNLLFSLILKPDKTALGVLPITMALSLGIAETLTRRLGIDVGVKWPNDVIAAKGKLCGVLSESATRAGRVSFVIVGIGINVNMKREQFPAGVPAASCFSITGTIHDRKQVLADVLHALETIHAEFLREGFPALLERYIRRLVLMDKPITFRRGPDVGQGEVIGVQPDGALVVRTDGGSSVTLYDEEVEFST